MRVLAGTPFAPVEDAVWVGLLAGTLLPLLGMWVVLQRVVFLGVTLSQLAAAGVALGFALHASPVALGLAVPLLVVAATVARGRVGSTGDAALGAGFCAASALTYLLISPSGADFDEVQHVLFGNLIFASADDMLLLAPVLLGGVLLVGLFFKEIVFTAFDAETARALGLRTRAWQMLLFAVLAVALGLCMRRTGSLLTFAMLVLPPLAALQLPLGLRTSFAVAALLGTAGTAGGLTLGVLADLHLESSVTLALFALVPVCAAFRRHPFAGVATLGAVLAAAALLVLSTLPAAVPHSHPHHHRERKESGEPFHADVRLSARRAEDGSLLVGWELHVERSPDVPSPSALWIVLTGDGGLYHEHPLVDAEHPLPPGHLDASGVCIVPDPGEVRRVEGQLWTGPPSALDAEPLDPTVADVTGADVR